VAAELWVNDSGVARQIREVWVNDSGVARRIQEIWVNDAGTARRVYVSDVISISDTTSSSSVPAGTATATYQLENDGDIGLCLGGNTIVAGGDWVTPATNVASYECRATVTSGALTSGTSGAWLNLATTRTWTLARASAGTSTTVFTLEIRRASDGVVLDTATITLQADRS